MKVLFVLCGLNMGGVETYILRLTKELYKQGCQVDVLIISKRYDKYLFAEISKHANIYFWENAPFFKASSWINAFIPLRWPGKDTYYDVVHAVDLLTLSCVFFNRSAIKFKALSVGVYHSMEIVWWRDKNVYFRNKMLELYDKNVELTLFPSESVASMAAEYSGCSQDNFDLLPLGIDLSVYKGCAPSFRSKKIVSVGRLVDFKVYNKHIISQLSEIRKLAEFEYYIYGDGPELPSLQEYATECGVRNYVHFMGMIEYDQLPGVLNGAFCFVGSGTTIIEASSAGVPSLVGIESIKQPVTCGFFSDVEGYSYNEGSASTRREPFIDFINKAFHMCESEYIRLSDAHRAKSACFDIRVTAGDFQNLSIKTPDFSLKFNRWWALLSFAYSIIRFGPKALKSRLDS